VRWELNWSLYWWYYCWVCQWNNFENWSIFDIVMTKP